MSIIRNTLIRLVTEKPGIKGVDLVMAYVKFRYGECLTSVSNSEELTSEYVIKTLEELVKEGELVEVEYTLPSMEYRVKSLYFPKMTTIRLV